MARKFAEGTAVPTEKTLADVAEMLNRIGCTQQMTLRDEREYVIAFVVSGVAYRISVPVPDPTSPEYVTVKINQYDTKPATAQQVQERVKQELARRMRAVAALLKARLVAIDEGITTMERAFVGDIVIGPNGQTVCDMALPQIMKAIEAGKQPTLSLPWRDS